MEDKSAIEILQEFAQKTGRKATWNEKDQSVLIGHTHTRHARLIWFRDKPTENRIFAAFSNPNFFGIRSFYSGVFIPVNVSKEAKINIRKKTIFDKINIPNLRKTAKFNNKKMDRKLMISGEQIDKATKIIGDPKIQQEIYDFMKKNPLYRIIINDLNMNYIPQFKTNPYLGLVREHWEIEGEKIENLFNDTKQFEKHL